MPREVKELQDHFGSRFEGSTLVSVDEIFWPVFSHPFKYSVRTTAQLTPVEEGLLRIVLAGVGDVAEASHFLGVGRRYVDHLVKRLSDTGDGHLEATPCLNEGFLYATPLSGNLRRQAGHLPPNQAEAGFSAFPSRLEAHENPAKS